MIIRIIAMRRRRACDSIMSHERTSPVAANSRSKQISPLDSKFHTEIIELPLLPDQPHIDRVDTAFVRDDRVDVEF